LLAFRALGTIELSGLDDGKASRVLVQPKLTALFAYLAIARPRGFHRRDVLLSTFWPEFDAGRARAALRSALHELRGNLSPDLIVNRGSEEVGIDSARLSCDVRDFEQAVDHDPAQAARIYRGLLLPSLFVREAPDFEHWLDGERDRLAREYRGVLERLAAEASARDDPLSAVTWWETLARNDPLNSRVASGLMRALAASGDRAASVRFGENHLIALRAEGVEPDGGFVRLVEEIRRGVTSGSASGTGAYRTETESVRPVPEVIQSERPQSERPQSGQIDRPLARRSRARWLALSVAVSMAVIGLVVRRVWPPSGTVTRGVGTAQVVSRPTSGPAYDAYLRGKQARDSAIAVQEFLRAIAIDPQFAQAYIGLVKLRLLQAYVSKTASPRLFRFADSMLHRALELDPAAGLAHAMMGLLYHMRDGDWVRSERELRTGVTLEPSWDVLELYAHLVNRLGRRKDAAILLRQAALIDPTGPGAKFALIDLKVESGDTAGALEEVARMRAVDPASPEPNTSLLSIQIARSQLIEALQTVNRWGTLSAVPDESNLYRAVVLARLGRSQEARAILPRADPVWRAEYPYLLIAAGDTAEGFGMMERLFRDGQQFEFLNGIPLAPELAENRQFVAVLRRYGIDPKGHNGLDDGWVERRFGGLR
jgi:DNA-binding SARP family transcriptional activator/Tfp pilus assembly protein PilF